jgi:hypothetical protein
MRAYTEMHARTVCMQAHLEGTANRLVEQGHDLVKVSTHRGACELCQPWQGKILSITGKTEGYPTLEEAKEAGLFHPNCRHAYGLYIDLDKEIEELEAELNLSPEEEKNYIEVEGLPEDAKTGLAKYNVHIDSDKISEILSEPDIIKGRKLPRKEVHIKWLKEEHFHQTLKVRLS